jgi:alpha/beta superfamily hydrolase
MARAFERPATIALPPEAGEDGGTLEGLWVPAPEGSDAAAGGAVIAPPHPMMGGSMESPVVTEIAWALQQAGLSSLRFNWRGVGASAGETSGDPAVAEQDYRAAVAFMRETVAGPLLGCGYSYGAATALRCAAADADGGPTLARLVLVAPPTRMLDAELLGGFPNEVLLVSGDSDEYVDASALAELARECRAARLEVIPSCDHFFMTGLGALRSAIEDWAGRFQG